MDYKKHDKNLDLENIELEVKSDNVKFDTKNIDAEVENLDFNIENNNEQTINSNDSVSSFNNDYEGSKTSSENSNSSGDTIGEPYDDGKQSDLDAKNDSFDIIDEEDEPINSDEMDSNDDSEPNEDKKESDSDGERSGEDKKKSDFDEEKSGEDKKESDSDGEKSSEDKKESESNGEKQGEEKKENKSDSSNENSNSKKEDNNSNEKNFNEKKNNSDDKTSAEKKPDNKKNNDKPKEKSDSNKVSDKKKNSNKHRKKRESLKDKWNNRPKNGKELANRAKSGAKKRAKNAFNNSKPGKAINNAKKAIKGAKAAGKAAAKAGKAAIKIGEKVGKALIKFFTSLPGIITLAVILSLLAIFIIFSAIFTYASPGVGGDVSDEENYSKYSEVDQKTIQKLKEISEKYPTGDPAYAMAATLYPYIEEMQSGNVSSLRARNNVEQEDEDDVYSEEEQNDNNNETEDDDLNDNLDDPIADDPYLELFRERKYRNKFKKLLKESRDGEEALTSYLKTTWFNKDAGYKELFDGVTDTEELADAIIDDILNQKDDFLVYFYDNCQRSYSTTSGGQITLDYTNDDGISLQELVTKNILVDVKSSSCTSTGKLTNCESLYNSPISMQKYIYGVTLQEIGDYGLKKDVAFMIVAKSYAIGRAMERGNVIKLDDDTYVIGIIDSTSDQAYCDYETFQYCSSGINSISEKTLSNFNEAWEISKNIFLLNGKKAFGPYAANVNSSVYCSYGTCMFQEEVRDNYNEDSYTYKEILQDQYRNKEELNIVTVESGFASIEYSTSSNVCKNNVIDDSNFVYYAQNDYTNTAFCHRKLTDDSSKNYCNNKGNSICTSGCGVTSMAMVVATLKQDSSITPETINSATREGIDCGDDGSNGDNLIPNFASTYGLKSEKIDTNSSVNDIKNSIKEALDSGSLVIGNTDGVFGSGTYKTGGGHYVVIRGYSENEVYVADPFQTSTMTGYCEGFNEKNQCIKLSTDFDTLINNVILHNKSGFYIISGGIPFSDNSEERLNDGIQNEYFAPVQEGNPIFGSTGSTPGCRNSVSHDLKGVSEGTKLYAGMDGVAEFKQTYCGSELVSYGNTVKITASDGTYIIYAHLKDFPSDVKPKITKTCAKKGSTPPCPSSSCDSNTTVIKTKDVKKGDYIGTLGNTGNSTGAHLHVEIHRSDRVCVSDPWTAFGMR